MFTYIDAYIQTYITDLVVRARSWAETGLFPE